MVFLVIFIYDCHKIVIGKSDIMSKDLPSIFKSPSNKKIENNRRVFYSRYESIGNVIEKEENTEEKRIELEEATSYREALDNLFKRNEFVFNVPVELITKEGTFHTKIVSKVGDQILTTSGKRIQLEDILSIRIKDM